MSALHSGEVVLYQEQPLLNPAQAAQDKNRAPASSKPVLRDLRRRKSKPGLTMGVYETESER